MKKTTKLIAGLPLALILLASGFNSKGQEFKVDDNVLSIGFGLGSTHDLYYGSAWPALLATYERGFKEINDVGIISLGAIAAFQHQSWGDLDWNNFYLMARGGFHLTMLDIDKLDVYGGISLGLRFYSEPYYATATARETETHVSPDYGLFVGGRYYFTENVAVFSELLYDVSWLKLGVSFKF